jgi:hypothetical protein
MWEEAVYLAYYLHWSLGEILDLPHRIRAQVIEQVGSINLRVSGGVPEPLGIPLLTGTDRETE